MSLLSLIPKHNIVAPNLIPYFVNLKSSCRKSYCGCTLVCPHHHIGSACRLQYQPLGKAGTPEQLSADQSQDSACKTITEDSN